MGGSHWDLLTTLFCTNHPSLPFIQYQIVHNISKRFKKELMSTVSTSPWALTTPVASRALADIMSEEQVANEMSVKEDTDGDFEAYNEEDFMTPEEVAAKRLAEELASLKLAEELTCTTSTSNTTPAMEDKSAFNEDDFLTTEEKADRDFALALAAQQEEEERSMQGKKVLKYGNSKVNVCASLEEHFLYSGSSSSDQHVQVSSDSFAAEALGAKLCGGVSFRNGVANVDGQRVSKHDGLIDGLMNSMSVNELDGAGDMSGLMVSNSVSNSLKSFSQKQKQKGVYVGGGGRVSSKDSRSTSETVLDESTRLLLFKLIQKNIFDEVHGCIKTGKESNVYHATKKQSLPGIPLSDSLDDKKETDGDTPIIKAGTENTSDLETDDKVETSSVTGSVASSLSHYIFENSDLDYRDVAVKVFKTTLNEFSNRIDYIKGDHRFSREKYAKNSNNKRKFIAQWVEKEFRNLCRARAKGLNVPRPLVFKANVLVMEMIVEDKVEGGKFVNSPQLKEVGTLPLEQWESCYEQTLDLVRDLYQKCRLVHADLSEYNLLLHNKEQVYVLDFGQALDTSHPEHKEYLLRDLKVVNVFFGKKGVMTRGAEEVLESIVHGGSESRNDLEVNYSPHDDSDNSDSDTDSATCTDVLADTDTTITSAVTTPVTSSGSNFD